MTSDAFGRLTEAERALLAPAAGASTHAMLATLTDDRFDDPGWIYEHKFDGVRCVAHRGPRGRVDLMSRNDLDMSATYPEVADAVTAALTVDAVLDGEVVAFTGRRTSFEKLQGRIGVSDPREARASAVAVFYYVYDILQLAGCDVRALPLLARKGLLRDNVDFGDPLRYSTHRRRDGVAAYEAACRRGEEGVMAKRADAPYTSGRSRDWLKFKCVRNQELVVGGWTDPQGSRADFGALLLGYWHGRDFVYAGKVGTGFTGRVLDQVAARLKPLRSDASPFTRGKIAERGVHWARPELVAEIAFTEWTRDGMLRHPRFQGLRTDKDAREVVRES